MDRFDFSPLFRSTIGFDRLARLVDSASRFDTAAPIRSERVRCAGSRGFGAVGQKTAAPNRLRRAGTSVRAARSMSPTPMMRPGARDRRLPMDATRRAPNRSPGLVIRPSPRAMKAFLRSDPVVAAG